MSPCILTTTSNAIAADTSADAATSTPSPTELGKNLLSYFQREANFVTLEEETLPECMEGDVANTMRLLFPALFMGPGESR